jgi:hypothetical protein
MLIKVTTTDAAWTKRYGFTVDSDGDALVPVNAYEELVFAGVPMVRFDMKAVARTMPRDWMNRWTMLPAAHVVSAS